MMEGKLDGTFHVEIAKVIPAMLEDALRGEIALADVIRVHRIPGDAFTIIWSGSGALPDDRQQIKIHTLTVIAASDRQEEAIRTLVEGVKHNA
jgi:hypothetical protein